MTEKQLLQLGFVMQGKSTVFHPRTETHFKLDLNCKLSTTSIENIIDLFHDAAFENGKSYGKILKQEEIKKALNLK